MAGDWIKMTHALRRAPEVVRIASRLKRDSSVTDVPPGVLRHVTIACLYTLWCVADEHATEDGLLPGYGLGDIDLEVGVDGFASAVAEEGWLKVRADGVELPKFERHNGNSAKKRIQATDRKRRERSTSEVSQEKRDNCHKKDGQKRDQRREEKSKSKSKKKNTPLTPLPSPGFTQFWNVVPAERKVGKSEAIKIWNRKNLEPRATSIAAALQRQLDNDQFPNTDRKDKKRFRFMPHPSTWLNREQWDDEVVERAPEPLKDRVTQFLPPVSDD